MASQMPEWLAALDSRRIALSSAGAGTLAIAA